MRTLITYFTVYPRRSFYVLLAFLAAGVAEASGVRAEAAWPFRRALVLGERWLRIESETVGVRRVGLLPARRVLSRELWRRVEALAG